MALDIYFVPSSTIINTNNTFATDLTGWTTEGSWTWSAEPGAVYDGDSEFNPLTQTVTLAVGWHNASITGGGITAGEYVMRIINLDDQSEVASAAINSGDYSEDVNFEIVTATDYQIAIYATSDADGVVENVRLTTTDNRTPLGYDDSYSLSYVEQLDNPIFYPDNNHWTDATSSWTNSAYLAVYDNDGDANPLQTAVTIASAGWYRLGIEAAAGSTIGQLTARVQGVNASYIYWHDGQRESFFYLAAGSYTVEFWTSSITAGGVESVSLMAADRVRGKKRHRRHTDADAYLTPADEFVTVDTTSADIYVYLPPLAFAEECEVIIKKTSSDANQIIVSGDGSETIDGSGSQSINGQYRSLTLVATTDEWSIVAKVT